KALGLLAQRTCTRRTEPQLGQYIHHSARTCTQQRTQQMRRINTSDHTITRDLPDTVSMSLATRKERGEMNAELVVFSTQSTTVTHAAVRSCSCLCVASRFSSP